MMTSSKRHFRSGLGGTSWVYSDVKDGKLNIAVYRDATACPKQDVS